MVEECKDWEFLKNLREQNKEFIKKFGMLKESEFGRLMEESKELMKAQEAVFSTEFFEIISVMTLICSCENHMEKTFEVIKKLTKSLDGLEQGIVIVALSFVLSQNVYNNNLIEKMRGKL